MVEKYRSEAYYIELILQVLWLNISNEDKAECVYRILWGDLKDND